MLITYSTFMNCEYFNYVTSCPMSSKRNGARLPLDSDLLVSTAKLSSPSSSLLSLKSILNLKNILLHRNESKIISHIFCHLVKYGQAE